MKKKDRLRQERIDKVFEAIGANPDHRATISDLRAKFGNKPRFDLNKILDDLVKENRLVISVEMMTVTHLQEVRFFRLPPDNPELPPPPPTA